jgi:hypothetical protein
LANIFGVKKTLQTLGGSQTIKDVFFLICVEIGFAANAF